MSVARTNYEEFTYLFLFDFAVVEVTEINGSKKVYIYTVQGGRTGNRTRGLQIARSFSLR